MKRWLRMWKTMHDKRCGAFRATSKTMPLGFSTSGEHSGEVANVLE